MKCVRLGLMALGAGTFFLVGCEDQRHARVQPRPTSPAQVVPRQQPTTSTSSATRPDLRLVTRVVDGDTIVLNGGERVRLIGVDTPESKHPSRPVERFAIEAAAFTTRLVKGKQVYLEYDWNRKDRYGRTLAYVYLADGTFVNAEIVREGYGHAYVKYPFKYMEEFRAFQREAMEKQRGLWAEE